MSHDSGYHETGRHYICNILILKGNYRQITLRIMGYYFSSRLTATLNLCLVYFKLLVLVL